MTLFYSKSKRQLLLWGASPTGTKAIDLPKEGFETGQSVWGSRRWTDILRKFSEKSICGFLSPFPWTLESCVWLIPLQIFDHSRSKRSPGQQDQKPSINNALFKRKQLIILSTTQVQLGDSFKCEYIVTCCVSFTYFCFLRSFLSLMQRLLHDLALKSTLEEHQLKADMVPLRQYWDCVWRCNVINFVQCKHKRVGWNQRNWDHNAQNDDDTQPWLTGVCWGWWLDFTGDGRNVGVNPKCASAPWKSPPALGACCQPPPGAAGRMIGCTFAEFS